jgi:hypothetical protein
MQERLQYKREIQSGTNDGVVNFYNLLLNDIFARPSDDNHKSSRIMEILSEGFWEKHNPAWAGLSVTRTGISTFESGEYQELAEFVQANRDQSSPHLRYKTHLEIGDHLVEPILFKVTEKSVEYYDLQKWRELNDLEKPLLLKPEDYVRELTESSQHAEKFEIHQDSPDALSSRRDEIKDCLIRLSRDVLWTAFFPPSNYPNGERISLIYIQASARRSVGVWALHAYAENSPIDTTSEPAIIYSTITPPILCLTETLMNLYKLEGTDQHRMSDVHLFQRCCGREQGYQPGTREEDDYIYNKSYDSDPFKRFRRIYDKACLCYREEFRLEENAFETVGATPDSLVFQLDEVFVHLFVAFAISKFKQTISHVTLRDALQKGFNILSRINTTSLSPADIRQKTITKLKESRIIEQTRNRLEHSYEEAETGFGEKDCLPVLTFTAALMACVALNTEEKSDNSQVVPIHQLSSRFAVLSQIFSENAQTPSLSQYLDWKTAPDKTSMEIRNDSLWRMLSSAGIPEAAVWIIDQIAGGEVDDV